MEELVLHSDSWPTTPVDYVKQKLFRDELIKEWRRIEPMKGWPPGPWDFEPDEMRWIDEESQYPCLILRYRFGTLNGYVGIPAWHPLWGKRDPAPGLDVHGGITYDRAYTPCAATMQGFWWLGFDTGHYNDYSPGLVIHADDVRQYKTITYVKSEVVKLARQLHAIQSSARNDSILPESPSDI